MIIYRYLITITALIGLTCSSLSAQDTLRLTLDKALEIALEENLSIKTAESEIERVNYLKKENQAALLPALNASVQYTNNLLKPVFFADFFPGGKMTMGYTHSNSVGATFQVPIFSMALLKNIEISKIDLQAAIEAARGTKIEMIAQVKNSYYAIIMMQESLDVLEKSYKNASETADEIRRKYEVGIASEYDKIRSDVAVRNLLPALTQARNGVQIAMMQLKILLSISLEQPLKIIGQFSDFEPLIQNNISEYNSMGQIDNNSDIKALSLQLNKLSKTKELISAQRLPSLSGFANYQTQMQNEHFKFDKAWSNSLSLGVVLQIPIFNKLSVTYKERQTKAGIQQLKYKKELLEQSLLLGISRNISEMNRAKTQFESDKEAVIQAEKGYEISKVRYDTGAGTLLELNDSETALTRSKLNQKQALYDFLKAKIELEKIVGAEDSDN